MGTEPSHRHRHPAASADQVTSGPLRNSGNVRLAVNHSRAGDFNTAAEASESYRILTGGGLADSWATTAERLTPAWGTFAGYNKPVEGKRIDWLLHNGRIRVLKAATDTYRKDGYFPSDYLPVHALLELACSAGTVSNLVSRGGAGSGTSGDV
ncbi:endonuclease/exonuclease/phosphatase family protein [Saccharopolyspora sp. NPDC000995]